MSAERERDIHGAASSSSSLSLAPRGSETRLGRKNKWFRRAPDPRCPCYVPLRKPREHIIIIRQLADAVTAQPEQSRAKRCAEISRQSQSE